MRDENETVHRQRQVVEMWLDALPIQEEDQSDSISCIITAFPLARSESHLDLTVELGME